MTPSQIIQRIHEEAKRPEVHAKPSLYRAAVARERIWRRLNPTARKQVMVLMEGDFSMVDIALEDVAEVRV